MFSLSASKLSNGYVKLESVYNLLTFLLFGWILVITPASVSVPSVSVPSVSVPSVSVPSVSLPSVSLPSVTDTDSEWLYHSYLDYQLDIPSTTR